MRQRLNAFGFLIEGGIGRFAVETYWNHVRGAMSSRGSLVAETGDAQELINH
jgi:hypothetical protein